MHRPAPQSVTKTLINSINEDETLDRLGGNLTPVLQMTLVMTFCSLSVDHSSASLRDCSSLA